MYKTYKQARDTVQVSTVPNRHCKETNFVHNVRHSSLGAALLTSRKARRIAASVGAEHWYNLGNPQTAQWR